MDTRTTTVEPRTFLTWRLGLALVIALVVGLAAGLAVFSLLHHNRPAAKRQTVVAALSSQPLLANVRGSEPQKTQPFKATGDWLVNWSYDCSGAHAVQGFTVDVFNGNGVPSYGSQPITGDGLSGSGSYAYHRGGEYYLDINSHCQWQVQVKGAK
jgi:hypothetical protein